MTLASSSALAQPPQLEVQAVASTGSMPKGVSLSPDGKHAYVTNFGQADGKNIDIYDADALGDAKRVDLSLMKVIRYRSPVWAAHFRALRPPAI